MWTEAVIALAACSSHEHIDFFGEFKDLEEDLKVISKPSQYGFAYFAFLLTFTCVIECDTSCTLGTYSAL